MAVLSPLFFKTCGRSLNAVRGPAFERSPLFPFFGGFKGSKPSKCFYTRSPAEQGSCPGSRAPFPTAEGSRASRQGGGSRRWLRSPAVRGTQQPLPWARHLQALAKEPGCFLLLQLGIKCVALFSMWTRK